MIASTEVKFKRRLVHECTSEGGGNVDNKFTIFIYH